MYILNVASLINLVGSSSKVNRITARKIVYSHMNIISAS